MAETKVHSRKKVDLEKLQRLEKEVLELLGVDTSSDHFRDSPKRISKALVELTLGLDEQNLERMKTTFEKACLLPDEECDNMITYTGQFYSLCAHHFLPFFGRYILSYIPGKLINGASKVQRIVNFHAAKPQVQEQLAHDIAETFSEIVRPKGLAIWMGGVHLCMVMRGIKAQDAWMENRHLQGEFNELPERRLEFSAIVAARGGVSFP